MTSEIVRSERHTVRPFHEIGRRLPEAGRIRLGAKATNKQGREYPTKLNAFRFTSHDRHALEALAEQHGGTVRAWVGARVGGQYELISKATRLEVALPPEPLSQHYELWNASACLRRCDGITFQTSRPTPDGAEVVDAPCVCDANGKIECKATSRLTVVIRHIPFAGGWLLTTGSWIAAKELPGMVELIQLLQGGGLTTALLTLKEASKPAQEMHRPCRGRGCADCNGGYHTVTHKWMVPALALPNTIDELAQGVAQLGALAQGRDVAQLAIDAPLRPTPAAIEADARTIDTPTLDDDEIAVGEIVDGEPDAGPSAGTDGGSSTVGARANSPAASSSTQTDSGECEPPLDGDEAGPGTDTEASPAGGAAGPAKSSPDRMRAKLHVLVKQCVDKGGPAQGIETDRFRHAAILTATGADQSSNSLMPDELAKVLDVLDDIAQRRRQFKGIDEQGLFRLGERQ